MSSKAGVHILVEGRVQGVYFRWSTRDEARDLNLTGWVRNLYDGTVEVMAEGEKDRLDLLIEWCRHGPPGARVTDVSVEWQEYTGQYDSFFIRSRID